MSELEPNDSRVVHGNARPEKGDERFAQKPERKSDQAESPTQSDQFDHAQESLDDETVRNPEQSPSTQDGERGSQQEQSVENDPQFEASDLDHGEAQYQSDPLIQQQHQQSDWDRGQTQNADFETGQADYGSAQARQEIVDEASSEGDLSDDDIEDAAPEQARFDNGSRDIND